MAVRNLRILFATLAMAAVTRGPTALQKEYPRSWDRLVHVHANATWTIRVTNWRSSPEGEVKAVSGSVRLLARWPQLRLDELDDSGAIRRVFVVSAWGGFRARRLAATGTFVLERWWPDRERAMYDFGGRAVNRGWLPLLPWNWFGVPLRDFLLEGKGVRITSEGWNDAGGRYIVEIAQRMPGGQQLRGKLWFVPSKGWVLWRWHWPYVVADGGSSNGLICELRYDREVEGVPIVTYGQARRAQDGRMVWEAKLVSFDPVAPPETAFRPESLGIPTPGWAGFTRLWLWAVLATLGLLTGLLLLRILVSRRTRNQAGEA